MYRRTNNLSLNSALPTSSSPLVESNTQDQPVASTSALPPVDASTTSPATSVALTEETSAPAAGPTPAPATVKRKLRSTSTRDPSTPKRVKSSSAAAAGGSSSTADKHQPPTTRLADLGGVDSCVEKMLELVALPLTHPEVYLHTGVRPPRGVLLVGPPGCGKTMLAGAIAGVSVEICFKISFRKRPLLMLPCGHSARSRNLASHSLVSLRQASSQACLENRRRPCERRSRRLPSV